MKAFGALGHFQAKLLDVGVVRTGVGRQRCDMWFDVLGKCSDCFLGNCHDGMVGLGMKLDRVRD